jgi:hypothetical protein
MRPTLVVRRSSVMSVNAADRYAAYRIHLEILFSLFTVAATSAVYSMWAKRLSSIVRRTLVRELIVLFDSSSE